MRQDQMEAQFLYNPAGTGPFCHAGSLLRTSAGDLLAAWYAYPEEEHRGASLVLARRPDGQSRWNASECILDDILDSSAGNPVLFQDPKESIWLLFALLKGGYWNDAVVAGSRSSDGGRSWSAPVTLWRERGIMIRHPPVLLENGSLLLPAYREADRESVLLKSHSPYSEWRLAYRFEDLALIQPVLAQHDSARLEIYFRPGTTPHRIWRSLSTDGGATWSVPVRTSLPSPSSGLAAFLHRGRTVLVYNHTEDQQRHPLSLSLSRDGGITWGNPWHLETQPFEVCYPSFLVDPGEYVHGLYTYNRRMIKYICFPANELDRL